MNSIGLPNKGLDGYPGGGPARAGRASGAADRQRHGVQPRRGGRAGRRRSPRAPRSPRSSSTCRAPTWRPGLVMGADPARARARCSTRVRPLTDKPLIVKLSPNAGDVAAVARAAEEAGADALSLINTIRGMALDPGNRRSRGWAADRRRLGAGGASDRAGPGGCRARSGGDSRSSGWAACRAAGTPSICCAPARRWWRSEPRASAIRRRADGSPRSCEQLLANSGPSSAGIDGLAQAEAVSGTLVG